MNRQKHKLSRRILAVLLMAAMLITMLPSAMFAQDGQAEGQTPVAVNNGSGESQNSVTTSKDGIVINKSVDQTDNGYELTLEAYASERTSTVTSTQPLDIVLVLDQSGSMADPFGGWGSGSRRAALQDAAEDFVNSVATNGGENHRIGIVTFDSGARVSKDFTYVSDEGVKDLNDTIDRLSADGATRVDRGLDEANDMLNDSARSDAQKIVIVFTDGDPTSGSSFEEEVAAAAINTAKTIKDKGATIYTIGIFSGANPNTDNNANNYMNAMSSNYPKATAEGDNGTYIPPFGYVGGSISITNGDRAEGNYYLAASNSEQLNAVFEQIYEEIGGLASNPTAESVLSDTLSQYFVLPEGTNEDNITVEYVEAASYNEKTGFTFEQSGKTPEGITVTINGKTIKVTGFDYKKHVASAKLQDDDTYAVTGGKLVVKIPIELDSQEIDGTGIYDTNDTDQNKAGLEYFDKDNKDTELKLDKSPSVAVTAYTVTYDWGEDVPEDVTLPVDNDSYLQGQSYSVDTTYSAGYTVNTYDEYGNVNGTYTFSGWTDPNKGVMGDSNVTITGSWTFTEADKYEVSYSFKDNVKPDSVTAPNSEQYYENATVKVHEGYEAVEGTDSEGRQGTWTFNGWETDDVEVKDGSFTMPAEKVELVGSWTFTEADKYEVSYSFKDNVKPDSVTAPNSEQYYEDATVKVHEGYEAVEGTDSEGRQGTWTFNGWETDDVEVKDGSFTMPAEKVELVGSWTFTEADKYEVSYSFKDNVKPDSVTAPNSEQYYENAAVKVHEGYEAVEGTDSEGRQGTWTFNGWETDDVEVKDGSFTMPAEKVELVGSWTFTEADKYEVSYSFKDNVKPDSVTAPNSEQYYENATVKVHEGYEAVEGTDSEGRQGTWTFNGWETDDVEVKDGSFTMPAEKVELVGSWTFTEADKYEVSYSFKDNVKPDSVTAPNSEQYYENATVKVHEGYEAVEGTDSEGRQGTWTFNGWETDDVEVKGGSFTMPAEKVELVGSWTFTEADKYEVSYSFKDNVKPDSVTAPNSEQYYENATVKVHEGYEAVEGTDSEGRQGTWTFNGWETDDVEVKDGSFTMPAEKVELVGSWTFTEADKYEVSYSFKDNVKPDSVTAPNSEQYYENATVKVHEGYEAVEGTDSEGRQGTWTFNGWETDDVEVKDGSFTMPAEKVELVGSWEFTATTYNLKYNANGGKYRGGFKDQEAATVFGLDSGDYDIWTIGENGKETGKMPESEFLPIHEPVIDTDTEEEFQVVFVGWSEKEDDTLYKKGDYLPDTVLYKPGTQVTIADADKTLYAVWGYDKNKNGTADVLEKLTLTYDINGGYGTEPVDRNPYMKGDQVTLETEALPVHSPADDGTAVVFLGWGLKQVNTIYAAGQDYSAAGVTESVTFEDEDITVYAVWGYDENNDGVADATQVLITPADITAYTGGTPYGGIADINGNIITETDSGLPEPGYFITLPYDVQEWLDEKSGDPVGAEDLSEYMTFTYSGTDGSGGTTTREWGLEYQGVYETDADGTTPLRYVYSLTPATVDGKEIPVRLNYFKDTNNNGKLDETETALTNDDITMSEDLAHDTFSMTINPGELDQSVIKAAFNANGDTKDSTVGIGTGTLTVKSVTDVDTTTNAIGNSESDVTENTLTAVANGSVTYYVNDSQVDVDNKTDRVQLLVDSVSNNDEFNAQMGQHAIETVEGSSDTHDYELAYMDLVDTANGNAEIKLGDNDKLTIYWPMPENADPNGDFQVVHYTDMNREGTVDDLDAVNTQTLKATQVTVNGMAYLTFEVSSFSPFALVYTADDGTDTPDYPDYPIWTPDGDDDGPSGLNTEDHFSYVVGYAEDYRTGEATDNEDLWPVKPNNQITRAEVATIFYRLLEDEVRDEYDTTTNDFSDVTADSWYNQTVSTLARMGIVKGYEDGSFRPNAPITRAEFGAIATRFFAETGATYEPGTFTDVTGDEWFANAIQDAVNLGLIGGYPDGTVRPNNNITRAEACAIVNRTLGRVPDADHLLPEDVMKVWPDNNPTDWFYADMQEATNGHEYAWIEEDGHEIEEWTNLLDKDWTDR